MIHQNFEFRDIVFQSAIRQIYVPVGNVKAHVALILASKEPTIHDKATPTFFPPFPLNSTSIDVSLVKIGPASQEKSFGKTDGDSPNSNIHTL